MSYLHGIYMEITSDLHAPDMLFTCYLFFIYMEITSDLHAIYIGFTCFLHKTKKGHK